MLHPLWNKLKDTFSTRTQKAESKKAGKDKGSKLSFFHWMVIVICLGLAMMILNNFFTIQDDLTPTTKLITAEEETEETFGSKAKTPESLQEYEEAYENQLREVLEQVVGVGDVSIVVNLDATGEVVYEKNKKTTSTHTEEKDREGGNRKIEEESNDEQIVLAKEGSNDQPVIKMKKKPKVRGVVIVATGASNVQVKAWIIEAVTRVLDVPTHQISVLPKRK